MAQDFLSRPLADIRLAALMLDGIELKGHCCVVALGVTTDGIKAPLGLWDGSTENKTVAAHLLSDLVQSGLDVEQGVLVVLDGSKALRAAAREVFGPVPVQRCVRHKERGVLDHLPERDRPVVKARLRQAWASDDHALALDGLRVLASELERSHPGAAASLREGLEETLTLTRLGIRGRLKKTLQSTNPIDSMIEIVRRTSRNVKRWQSGDMCLRWTAAGMLKPSCSSARSSATATSRSSPPASSATSPANADRSPPRPARRPLRSPPPDHHTGTAATKFHDGRDSLQRRSLRVGWQARRPRSEVADGAGVSSRWVAPKRVKAAGTARCTRRAACSETG